MSVMGTCDKCSSETMDGCCTACMSEEIQEQAEKIEGLKAEVVRLQNIVGLQGMDLMKGADAQWKQQAEIYRLAQLRCDRSCPARTPVLLRAAETEPAQGVKYKIIEAGGRSSLKTTRGGLLAARSSSKQVCLYRVTSADLRWLADSLAKREAAEADSAQGVSK